jgi:hypothetical protein
VDWIELLTNDIGEPIFVDLLVMERAKGKRGCYLGNLPLVRKKRAFFPNFSSGCRY